MLYGEFTHNVDKKGRMFVPSKFRDDLGEKFMICKGLDGKPCLFIYSMEEWQKLDEKIQSMPVIKSRQLQRFVYAGASDLECDAQGRVLLPQNLREYAGIDGPVQIIGVSKRVEIWNKDRWLEESSEYTGESMMNIMEGLEI